MDGPLFFLHVPRTGGTSLLSYLDTQFAPGEVCPAHEQHEFEALEAEGRLGGYKFYRGHFGVNLADHVPEKGRWITWLRDPVERVYSTWKHQRRIPDPPPDHPNWRYVEDVALVKKLDFPDYCRARFYNGVNGVFNLVTGVLGRGAGWGVFGAGRPNDDMYERAKAALSSFAYVGLTETYAGSLARLQRRFGLAPCPPQHLNSAPGEDGIPGDRQFRNLLDRLTAYDRALYDHATALAREVA